MASLENTKNICPAIIPSEETHELTEEEFQRTLVTWFEDRGLLSELRTHLRKQMIGIIKDTTLGQTTKDLTKLSPKDHITNLLIAEYLLKHRYHYSLSVFSTEVPYFMNMLPDFSKGVQMIDNTINIKNFNQKNFCDILEALGFVPESYESKKLYDSYFNNNNRSLLNCMISLLPKITKLKMIDSQNFEETVSLEAWLKDIHNLLIHYEINSNYVINLRNQIKLIFESQLNKMKKEEEIKFKTKQVEINEDIVKKEGEIKKLITEMESTYNRERKKMSEEHMKELKNVEKLKIQYKQLKNDYESRFDSLEKREKYTKQRELELEKQLEVLKKQTKIMQNVHDSLVNKNIKISEGIQSQDLISKLNTDDITLCQEIQTSRRIIENVKKIPYTDKQTQTLVTTDNSEHQLIKQMLERVQKENEALRILNSEQQSRLDEISTQNVTLINDLYNCQSTINMLTRNNTQRGIITVPPIMPSAPFSRGTYRISNLNGGGENLGFIPPTSPPIFRHAGHNYRNYSRRKARVSPNKESSSSSSPTEDILVEARERLRRLERESESIDRHYRTFRERQSRENVNAAFSINNIPDSIRAQYSENREALFSTLRPTFQNRLSELPSTSTRYFRPQFNFSSNQDSKQSFVFGLTKQDVKTEDKENEKIEENKTSAGPSAASSRISQLQNLSLSSIELSSDSDDVGHIKKENP